MIRKTLLEKTHYLYFNNTPTAFKEKSSNFKCFRYLNRMYFESPISLTPWEPGFFDKFLEYVKIRRQNNKYFHLIYECLIDSSCYGIKDEKVMLALALKFYLNKWGGTYGTWHKPKTDPYDVKGFDRIRMYVLATKPITLHNILYNFYEYLFPGNGLHAHEVNYMEALVFLRRKYERITKLKPYDLEKNIEKRARYYKLYSQAKNVGHRLIGV